MRIGLSLKLPEPKYNVLAQNVQALFADGSQGWFYDNQDLSTLFQDSAGTTPVTAVEQSVGLQLDKSKGLVLGPELVTNGDFSQGSTGWTLQGTVTISGGVAVINSSSSADRLITASLILPAGKTVKVEFDVTVISGGVQIQDTLGGNTTSFTTSGRKTLYMSAASSAGVQFFRSAVSGSFNGTLDNISVRELPGNHRYQTTSGSRPVWSKRVNRLTKTEQFDDAVWSKQNASITATNGIAPDGTATADTLTENTANTAHGLQVVGVYTGTIGKTNSIYVKAAGRNRVALGFSSSGGLIANTSAVYDLTNGTIVTQPIAPSTASITSVGNGWYRLVLVTNAANVAEDRFVLNILRDTDASPAAYTGDGVSGVLVWAADARFANQATGTIPLYQRVNTATDYDTNGFPGYLKADGTDDFLQTNSIDFTATDKVTLCAGVRKLSDAVQAMLIELSTDFNASNGSFLSLPNSSGTGAASTFAAASRGSATPALSQFAVSAATPAPVTTVFTQTHDISGDLSAIRLNGAPSGTNGTGDKGSGNFGNYPVYFFRRAGTSLPFNGEEYANIAVGKLLTADQLTALETYVNGATRAY